MRSLCIGFWYRYTIAFCCILGNEACIKTSGIAVSLAPYVVPCVRFSCFVRPWTSFL